jgi:integrase
MPEIASQSSRAFTGQTTPRAYTIVGLDRYGCATRRSKGTCTNALLIGRQAIEERVLGGLRFRADCVFHSIRKTVATMFKDASVPEATAADILGHEIATMKLWRLCRNVSLATKRDAIEKLAYPKESKPEN